jgi:GNAT superfamily N-acetyltransferase
MAEWRAMTESDIPGVLDIAARVHPALPESAAVFHERLRLFPAGSLVLAGDGPIGGYTVSHPIRAFEPPALDTLLGRIPSDADDYYIHDFALAPEQRGTGLARAGIEILLRKAEAFSSASLVSVYGTANFWSRFGFRLATRDGLQRKLAPYGPDAVYMRRVTAGGPEKSAPTSFL